jgi:WW domain-binding protein 4
MGSDRQSVLLHEQGKKHQQNQEKNLSGQRQERLAQQEAATSIQNALQQISQAAVSSHLQDVEKYGTTALHAVAISKSSSFATNSAAQDSPSKSSKKERKSEKKEWESRKKKRLEEKQKQNDDEEVETAQQALARRVIAPNEGHYRLGETIYLEGETFVELLEEEMPLELWTGPAVASLAEMRLAEKQLYWKKGLLLNIRKSSAEHATGRVLDIAYLKDAKDEGETLEKSIPPRRIRLVLGGDDSIPDTVEEARVAATPGGQVVKVQDQEQQQVQLDENTGFSSWGTVQIRQTTVRQELKEERERQRQQQGREAERQEEERKRAEGRRMEEARVENAEDSALGAYDFWNAGQLGYKGVNIHLEEKMTIADATGATKLSGGKKVEFKKSDFKKKVAKQNRRTTSADDL